MKIAVALALAHIFIAVRGFLKARNMLERVINFDLAFFGFVILVILFGAIENQSYCFDLSLVGLMFSFLGSVLVAGQYIEEAKLKNEFGEFINH